MSNRKRILCITDNGEEIIFGTIKIEGDYATITDERDDEPFTIHELSVLEVTNAPLS